MSSSVNKVGTSGERAEHLQSDYTNGIMYSLGLTYVTVNLDLARSFTSDISIRTCPPGCVKGKKNTNPISNSSPDPTTNRLVTECAK